MDKPLVRNIVAALAGLVAAVLVVMLAEGAGHLLFPPPEDLDLTKSEDQARLMDVIPMGAKIAVILAWFLGALAGACVARRIANVKWPAWVPTGFMVFASLWTTTLFPHPTWMVAAAVILPIAALLIAGRVVPLKA